MNYRLVKKESQILISLMRSEKAIWVYQKLKRKFDYFPGRGPFWIVTVTSLCILCNLSHLLKPQILSWTKGLDVHLTPSLGLTTSTKKEEFVNDYGSFPRADVTAKLLVYNQTKRWLNWCIGKKSCRNWTLFSCKWKRCIAKVLIVAKSDGSSSAVMAWDILLRNF